jgi:hypothetical protein
MKQTWPDWRPCSFAIMIDGNDVEVVRYRRIRATGPNRAVFDLVIVDPGTQSSRKITVEMRRIMSGSAEDAEPVEAEV